MFCIEKLDKLRHDRNSFISSSYLFDDYLKKFANQDIKRNKTIVYVAVQPEDSVPKRIYGRRIYWMTIGSNTIPNGSFNMMLTLHAWHI